MPWQGALPGAVGQAGRPRCWVASLGRLRLLGLARVWVETHPWTDRRRSAAVGVVVAAAVPVSELPPLELLSAFFLLRQLLPPLRLPPW